MHAGNARTARDRGPARAAAGAAALVVWAAACGGHRPPFEGAVLHLAGVLDEASVEVRTPLPLSGSIDEVVYVRDGLASIVVTVPSDAGVGGEAGGRALERFPLPLAAAPAAEAADLPELVGLPLPRVDGPEARPAGFWVSGAELGIVRPADEDLPDELRLRYTVHAALLAGTAEGAGFARRDVFRVRSRRGARSAEAIAVPAGATLALELPPVGAGRIDGALRALAPAPLAGGAPGAEAPRVVVRLDGATLADELVPYDGAPLVLGGSERPGLEVERAVVPRTLAIEVHGSPGTLAFLEAPTWSRERSWREGPNALLVVVDGLRPDRLGCYGDRGGLTPNLDALARGGRTFLEAWSVAPWSLPAMATLLTSLQPTEHQALRHDRRLGRGVTTLPEVFRESGYRADAITDGGFVAPAFGVDRGFATFDARGGDAATLVERTLAHLDRHGDRPWFVLLHVADPTPPFEPPEAARADVALRHPEKAQRRAPEPLAFHEFTLGDAAIPSEMVGWLRDLYAEEVRATDRALGDLFAALKERGLYDGAVILVTAGHGVEIGDHGGFGHGDTLFPEVLRVPLVLKQTRGTGGGLRVREPVSIVDVAPTLLDAADLRGTLDATTFGGRSLIGGRRPSPVFALREHPVAGRAIATRHDRYLFVNGRSAYGDVSGSAIYDLRSDPYARTDRSGKLRSTVRSALSRAEAFVEAHPPRVEGAENALPPSERARIDPLPGAKRAPRRRGRGRD